MSLVAEPALYVFASDGPIVEIGEKLRTFITWFEWLIDLADANELSIHISRDLWTAISTRFPFGRIPSGPWASMHGDAVPGYVLRRMERVALLLEYEGNEDEFEYTAPLARVGEVYRDDDVWIAWQDTLGQHARSILEKQLGTAVACGAPASASSLVGPEVRCRHLGTDASTVLGVVRVGESPSGAGLIDAAVALELTRRVGVAGLSRVAWEDSGHQPSAEVKAFIVRVARDSGIAVRVASTEHLKGVPETCKVLADEDPSLVKFRVSNGRETVKGCFHVTSRTAQEAGVALTMLGRAMRRRCGSESEFRAAG